MKNIIKISILAIALLPFFAQAQDFTMLDDGGLKPYKGTFALTNAKIVTVTKGVIERGTIIINDGIIQEIGSNVAIPAGAEVINCEGKTIYPGMIDSGTRLGLVEVGSLPETQDNQEIGNVKPHIKALTAVNPNATAIPVTRVSGVTTAITMPSGGLIPGQASLINLVGYTPNQMHAGFDGITMNFPSMARRGFRDRRSDADIKREAERVIKDINDMFDRAALYRKNEEAGTARFYPELAALARVVAGEISLMLEVNSAQDIEAALEWIKDRGLKNVILTGVSEGWRVADKIAASGIPVLAGPVITLPARQSDRYDRAYTNPGIMSKAGVKVALRTMDTENVRNLPFNAGFAAAYGMGKDEALRAVTINPAEIFGVADRLGSLEKGKSATLFVTDGDPFEHKTQIYHVFIDGYNIPMISLHTRLYQEFLERSPGVDK
jgi:imidazolonepropionase-like amidohydrolase